MSMLSLSVVGQTVDRCNSHMIMFYITVNMEYTQSTTKYGNHSDGGQMPDWIMLIHRPSLNEAYQLAKLIMITIRQQTRNG